MAEEERQTQEAQQPGSYQDMLNKMGIAPLTGDEGADGDASPDATEQEDKGVESSTSPENEQPPIEEGGQEGEEGEDSGGDNTTETQGKGASASDKKAFEINDFNQKFKTDFKDEQSLLSAIEASQRIEELEAKAKKVESLEEENLLLKQKADPRNFFASEDDFKAALFKKQFPDKDAGVAYKLMTSDLSTMSDSELIAQNLLLDNPDIVGGLKGALEIVNDKFGIEEGVEVDNLTLNKMKVDARAAKKNIEAIKSQIQLPDKFDADSLLAQQKELQTQKQEQLSAGWKRIGEEMVKTLPDIVLYDKDSDGKETETFRYSMSKDFSSDTMDKMVSYMAAQGIEPDRENVGALMDVMQKEYLLAHKEDIIKAAREDAIAKNEEQRLQKQNNTGKPPKEKAPEEKGKGDQDKLLARLRQGHSKHVKQ